MSYLKFPLRLSGKVQFKIRKILRHPPHSLCEKPEPACREICEDRSRNVLLIAHQHGHAMASFGSAEIGSDAEDSYLELLKYSEHAV